MEKLTTEQTSELELALRMRAKRLSGRTGLNEDDLYQEGWLGVLQAHKQFDPSRGRLMMFLIAKGQLAMQDYVRSPMEFGRSVKPRPTKLSLDHTSDEGELSLELGVDEVAPDEVTVRDVMTAAGLDAREWRLALLRLQGNNQAECAFLLKVSETRIPQLLARIQSKLRAALDGRRSSRAVEHQIPERDLRPNVFQHPTLPRAASLFA